MSLYIVDREPVQARNGQRLGNEPDLRRGAGRRKPHLSCTIIVYGCTENDRSDLVAVRKGLFEASQRNDAAAVTKHRSVRAFVERLAVTVRREDPTFFKQIAHPLGGPQRNTAGQCQIALTAQQGRHPLVDRYERCGACTLHADTWPL